MQARGIQLPSSHRCTDFGVPCVVMTCEPGGPGVPAGAKSQWAEAPLTRLLTWPLTRRRIRRSQLLENRRLESSWTAVSATRGYHCKRSKHLLWRVATLFMLSMLHWTCMQGAEECFCKAP
eukprot:2145139-Amphidinium_carterae.1